MKLTKKLVTKTLVLTLTMVTFGNSAETFASEEPKLSNPEPFVCVDMASPIYAKVKAAMRVSAQQLLADHSDFAKYGFGYGNCIDLKKKSILSLAVGQELTDLPDTCVGFSLATSTPQELPNLAQQLVSTQDAVLDGKNGSMIVLVDGNQINVPICLESFSFGGPQ